MIVPSFAAPLGIDLSVAPASVMAEQWYIYANDRLLVSSDENNLPNQPLFSSTPGLYLGTYQQQNLYAGITKGNDEAPAGWAWRSLRSLYGKLSEPEFAIAGRALQLVEWDRTSQYCGRCGTMTHAREHERCRECPACNLLSYPKLAPAIMALIRREDKILLARSPHFPKGVYSVLAGYLDPGETLEQCVAREVFEEVGLKVANIRYFGSQPWPFSRSMMIAFECDWEEGEIHIDPTEIEDACWFDRSCLPVLPPHFSISRILIDSYVNQP